MADRKHAALKVEAALAEFLSVANKTAEQTKRKKARKTVEGTGSMMRTLR